MNRLKHGYLTYALLILILLVSSTCYTKVNALNSPPKKVKVFVPLISNLGYLDEDGNLAGYTYEYLMKIAQSTGWEYEFVTAAPTKENMQKAIASLENGEIDILTYMLNEEPYTNMFNYTSAPYIQVFLSFMALKDSDLNKRTMPTINDVTIALNKNSTDNNNTFLNYMNMINYSPEIIYTSSDEECINLLKEGKADFVINNMLNHNPKLKVVSDIISQNYFFTVNKSNSDLFTTLNDTAIEIELSRDLYFQFNLTDKFFPYNADTNLYLLPSESEYVKNSAEIRVAILDNKAPISDFNEKTGKPEGIIIDFMDKIKTLSGLKFTYTAVDTYEQLKHAMLNGEVDLAAGFPNDYKIAKMYNVLLTSPLFKSPVVRISSKLPNIKNPEILASSNTNSTTYAEDVIYVELVLEDAKISGFLILGSLLEILTTGDLKRGDVKSTLYILAIL